jgi:hypothetical protein
MDGIHFDARSGSNVQSSRRHDLTFGEFVHKKLASLHSLKVNSPYVAVGRAIIVLCRPRH